MEHYKEIQKVLSHFEDGKERYAKSTIFNTVVHNMARGNLDTYKAISLLCDMVDAQQKNFENYAHNNTQPLIMSPNGL